MDLRQWFSMHLSCRLAIRALGILAGAGLSIDAGIFAASRATAEKYVSNTNPINHILIACQEITPSTIILAIILGLELLEFH